MQRIRKYRAAALTIITAGLILFGACATYAQAAPEGRIKTPKDGSEVDGVFETSGTIDHLPPDHELWLVVKKGDNLWPKKKAFVVGNRKWSATIDESATRRGGPYSLVLLSVDETGQAAIEDWYRDCEERNVWPAMPAIKGSTALDSVDVRRK